MSVRNTSAVPLVLCGVVLFAAVIAFAKYGPELREAVHGPPPEAPNVESTADGGGDDLDEGQESSPDDDEPTKQGSRDAKESVEGDDLNDADGAAVESTSYSLGNRLPSVISRLPTEERAVARLHDRSIAMRCEAVEPELPAYPRPYRTEPYRQHAFSVGLDVAAVDRRDLPMLSRSQILRYLHGRCLSLQVQVQPGTEAWFLGEQPSAAATSFGAGALTLSFTSDEAARLAEYRGVGLFVPSGKEGTPENLRTLVLLHRSRHGTSEDDVEENYEYLFVRAHPSEDASDQPELHSFVTTGGRQALHYLKSGERPRRTGECSIVNMLVFTEYTNLGLQPTASLTRESEVNDFASIAWSDLDEATTARDLKGGFAENVTTMLDALIAGEVR